MRNIIPHRTKGEEQVSLTRRYTATRQERRRYVEPLLTTISLPTPQVHQGGGAIEPTKGHQREKRAEPVDRQKYKVDAYHTPPPFHDLKRHGYEPAGHHDSGQDADDCHWPRDSSAIRSSDDEDEQGFKTAAEQDHGDGREGGCPGAPFAMNR